MRYNNWQHDLSDSVKALSKIKDYELKKVISGDIHCIENTRDDILIKLDLKSGVDYIRENDTGLQGIAARVQWGKSWDTFTIRSKRHTGSKTELEKRLEQIELGYIYPAFTLQAYFNNRTENILLSLGIIKTIDLYRFIIDNPSKVRRNKSDNEFIFLLWSDLKDADLKSLVKVYRNKDQLKMA